MSIKSYYQDFVSKIVDVYYNSIALIKFFNVFAE